MPKKKAHKNNNKNKKGKNKKDRNNNNTTSGPSNSSASRQQQKGEPFLSRSSHIKALQSFANLPSFGDNNRRRRNDGGNQSANTEVEEEPVGGYYECYKSATTRFWDWMKKLQRNLNSNANQMKGVNDLRRGADQILEHIAGKKPDDDDDINAVVVAPSSILSDLSTSIKFREMFTSARFGTVDGGDEGHSYMIEVLKYCRSVLEFARRVAKRTFFKQQRKKNDSDNGKEDTPIINVVGGRFNALLDIFDEEEDDDDDDLEIKMEKDIREGNIPSYSGPELEEDIDIQEALINGDDRFQAQALLHTMDNYMELVDFHYGLLKNFLRARDGGQGGHGAEHQCNNSIQLLMECTVAANMATESVKEAENALAANHPHLSSFYHILSLVFLPRLIASVDSLIECKVPAESHLALQFVAEVVECSFHYKGETRIPDIVQRFIKKMKMTVKLVDNLETEAWKVFKVISAETQLAHNEKLDVELNTKMRAIGVHPHMWLKQSPYIGGDRSILNTQKIIQLLMDLLQDTNTKLVGRPGFWGEYFDENVPAKKIRGDLDEPFASAIMPELLELCHHAPFQMLPDRSQLITVLDLLQQHIKGNRTNPVPLALTFGIHALLTSIYVLQGNGDLNRLASYTKQSFNKLFDQLEDLIDPTKSTQNAPIFYENVVLWKQIRNMAKPLVSNIPQNVAAVDPAYSEKLAIWNPLIGGEYMLYAIYMCSISLGSATVDSLGQLRFTLHLYNALKQNDPSLEQVPLLKELDKVFANTKAIWVGSKSEKGSFSKKFWMAWGMTAKNAAKMALERTVDESGFRRGLRGSSLRDGPQNDLRELENIYPHEYSISYRRLVERNFSDEEGQALYTVRNDSNDLRKNYDHVLNTMARINATRDAMDDDEDTVIPVNFSVIGCILLEFVNSLSEHMGWTDIIHQTVMKNPQMKSGKTMGGNRLKGFTASDLNFKIQGLAHFWGHVLSRLDKNPCSDDALAGGMFNISKIALLMKSFFEKVPRERYSFFVEKEEKPKRHNPLEGSYPHGNTGRSMRDPLCAIIHLKYNKKGNCSARMVTPGKLVAPPVDGDLSDVYEGPSKLPRGSSGKYRHIASYSLDELLELGWDGSKYTSTRAKHAASGHYVPFIPGYDSDSEDEYEPIDIQQGRRAGTIGLSRDQIGLYMTVPNMINPAKGAQIVQIKDPKGRA